VGCTLSDFDSCVNSCALNEVPYYCSVDDVPGSLLWGPGYMIHPRHTAIRYSTSMLKQETCPCAARGRVAGPISMHDRRCHLPGALERAHIGRTQGVITRVRLAHLNMMGACAYRW